MLHRRFERKHRTPNRVARIFLVDLVSISNRSMNKTRTRTLMLFLLDPSRAGIGWVQLSAR